VVDVDFISFFFRFFPKFLFGQKMIEEIHIIWSFSPRIGTLFKFKKKKKELYFVYICIYTPYTQFSFFHRIFCGTFFGLVFLLLLFIFYYGVWLIGFGE